MIVVQARLEAVKEMKTRKKLVFSTKEELSPIITAQIIKNDGYLAFSSDPIKKSVEAAMKDTKIGINEEGQSPSKILRGVLCQIWDKTEEIIPFEDYYKRSMDLIINHYKGKI
jgi:hypothetical protein